MTRVWLSAVKKNNKKMKKNVFSIIHARHAVAQ